MDALLLPLYLYAFLIGICITSFLSVVIWKLSRDLSFVKGRFYCLSRHHKLQWYNLFPVFSYPFLKGKCRYYGNKTSARETILKFLGGYIGMFCFYTYGFSWGTVFVFAVFMILFTITMVDFDTMAVPNGLIISLIVLVDIFTVLHPETALMTRAISFFVVSLPMCPLILLIPDYFGGGDIKLIAVANFLLGWKLTPLTFFISILIGGSYTVYLLLSRKTQEGVHVAFGPYLCAGIMISLLYGETLIQGYLSLFELQNRLGGNTDMAVYKYTAKDISAKRVTGKMEVDSGNKFTAFLRSRDQYLMDCKDVISTRQDTYKLTLKELSDFSRQLGAMTGSDVSLIHAMSTLVRRESKPKIKSIYTDTCRKLQQGQTLSMAMGSEGKAFPELMISIYQAGENSGQIEKIAMTMALQYERDDHIKREIRNTMTYPIILLWYRFGRLKLNVPKIGKLLYIVYTARFTRDMCPLYTSGIPIINGMQIIRNTIGSKYIKSQFDGVVNIVGNGASLSQSIQKVDGFDPKLADSIYIREESGRLETTLTSLVNDFDYESEAASQRMITLLEPAMIIILALIVLCVMLAVLLPIYRMYQNPTSLEQKEKSMAKEYTLFMSSHAVQMIYGSYDKKDMVKVETFHEYLLEESAMIDDVIADNSSILDILRELQENGLKEAQFVIDSGQILVKNIRVPQLSKKELLGVAKDKLADVSGSYEDLTYNYSILQSSFEEEERRGGKTSCCVVERKLLTSYVKLFGATGIKLKSVDISINALHKLTQELADLNGKTYIVSVLDDNNVSSYLFGKNHYTFSNGTRLFSGRGAQASTSETNDSISQLTQFSKSGQNPYPIERTYFCGLDDARELMVFESIRGDLNLQVEQFPDPKIVHVTGNRYKDLHLHGYMFPVGCLIRK